MSLWMVLLQHGVGMLNAWSLIAALNEGRWIMGLVSFLCLLITADWRMK